jgi:LDH2 family malate/lactate/ureidoglycolate dehydrogenase
MPVYADPEDGRAIAADELTSWTAAIIERLGTAPDMALDVATIVVASDRRGIASHGTARLPQYVRLVEAGAVDPGARPKQVRAKPALALFDAQNGWGHHASRVAVDAAIKGAKAAGTFTSVVKRSNHYGIAGWYALRAAAAGFVGISLTNSSPLVAPTRAIAPMLGTNPIAVAAPAGRHGIFCLDMATSTIPRGRIEVASRRGESLQPSWAIDAAGDPTESPEAALEGALLPLGGVEATGGYKGYGLTLLVDILTGVLGGGVAGPRIVPLFSPHHGPADLGQTFIVIDPDALDEAGAFEARLEHEMDLLIAAPTAADAPGRVLMPGEPEAEAERRSAELGVAIDTDHLAALEALAERFAIPLPNAVDLQHRA